MSNFGLTHADVADEGPQTVAWRWQRARAWKYGRLQMRRSAAVRVGVGADGHARGVAILGSCAVVAAQTLAGVQQALTIDWNVRRGMTPETQKAIYRRGDFWPDGIAKAYFAALFAGMVKRGFVSGDDDWLARERAYAKLFAGFRAQVKAWPDIAEPPVLLMPRDVACLRIGRVEARDGLLLAGPLGAIEPADPLPDNVASCAYAEAALIRRQWWLRFVFVSEAERKVKKGATDAG